MSIVLVGTGGYGQVYLNTLDRELKIFDKLKAVVDPYAKASKYYSRFIEDKIPIYETLDDFYKNSSADLAIISSPIHFHEEQTLAALNNGSHVLCEKPVTATVRQALNMKENAAKRGRKLGVGFQWSYSDRMRAFKRDILDGAFGRPVCLKSFLYWPRENAYYESGDWKGRIKSKDGRLINDSVLSNATSHYLHNMFFVLGESMNGSLMPESFSGSVFRLRDIESFDTCFLRGKFNNGSRFYYFASHSCGGEQVSEFEYEFEKCTVYINSNSEFIMKRADGELRLYDDVPENGLEGKVKYMLEAIGADSAPRCGIDTALPHLAVSNAIFDKFVIQNFPESSLVKIDSPPGVGVSGLYKAARECFENELLPNEISGFPMNNAGVTEITGL